MLVLYHLVSWTFGLSLSSFALQLIMHVRDATRQPVSGSNIAPLALCQLHIGVLRLCRHNASASSNGSGSRKGISRKQAAEIEEDAEEGGKLAALAAPAAVLTGLALLIGIGVAYKHELKDFIEHFVAVLDTWGPARCTSCPAVNSRLPHFRLEFALCL